MRGTTAYGVDLRRRVVAAVLLDGLPFHLAGARNWMDTRTAKKYVDRWRRWGTVYSRWELRAAGTGTAGRPPELTQCCLLP